VSTLALLWLTGVGAVAVILLLGVSSTLAAQRERLAALQGAVDNLEARMRRQDSRRARLRAVRRGVPPDDAG